MKIRQPGITSTSSFTCITQTPVTDNSEGSKPPWSLKVWVGLEGQIRNEKESQKNTLKLGKWGLVGKSKGKHSSGMKTIT